MIPTFAPIGLDLIPPSFRWIEVLCEFLATPQLANDVRAIGMGSNKRQGRYSRKLVIQAFVEKKWPMRNLPNHRRIPSHFESKVAGRSIPTDVLEVGKIETHGGGDARHDRPVPCSSAIGLANDPYVGTLGCTCVAEVDGEDRLCFLSNRHVLHTDNATVVQPAGGPTSTDRVGIVSKVAPIHYGSQSNTVDGALAICAVEGVRRDFINWAKPEELQIDGGSVKDVQVADRGLKVEKCGRTTARTYGMVSAVHASTGMIRYENPFPGGSAGFTDCIVIRGDRGKAFSKAGDSGSLVYESGSNLPVGLLFAGSTGGRDGAVTFAIPMATVMRELSIKGIFGGTGPIAE